MNNQVWRGIKLVLMMMSLFKIMFKISNKVNMNKKRNTIHFTDESIVPSGGYDANRCLKNNAQCVHIENYCMCHCLPGYISVDDKCLKSKIAFLHNNNNM